MRKNILWFIFLLLFSSSGLCGVRYPKVILRNGQALAGTFVYTSDTVLRMRSMDYGTITKYYAKELRGVVSVKGDTMRVQGGKIQGFSTEALLIDVQKKALKKKGKEFPQVFTKEGRWIVGEAQGGNDTMMVIENIDFRFAVDTIYAKDIAWVQPVRGEKMEMSDGVLTPYKEENLYSPKEYKKFKRRGIRPKRFFNAVKKD